MPKKIISLDELSRFQINNQFSNKNVEQIEFLSGRFRWLYGTLGYASGTAVRACFNRLVKITKETILVLNNIELYDFGFQIFDSSANYLDDTGWITSTSKNIFGYNYFKGWNKNAEFFVFAARKKDGSEIDIDTFSNDCIVYSKCEKNDLYNNNFFIGTTIAPSGQTVTVASNYFRATTNILPFSEDMIINLKPFALNNPQFELACAAYDSNGKWIGSFSYIDCRSMSGYEIKARIGGDIRFIILLFRTYANQVLTYEQMKEHVQIYMNKNSLLIAKNKKYCTDTLLSYGKKDIIGYTINNTGWYPSGNYWAQGLAIYNGYVFQACYDTAKANNTIIKLYSNNDHRIEYVLATIDLGVKIHAGTMCFGEKQNASDDFPLLYVESANDNDYPNSTCLVFKINVSGTTYSVTLVRTINIGFINDEIWNSDTPNAITGTNCGFAVDVENNLLIAFTDYGTKSNRVFVFGLPTADKTLQTTDIVYYFDIPYYMVWQDAFIHNSLLYISYGYGYNAASLDQQFSTCIRVIDYLGKQSISSMNLKYVSNKQTLAEQIEEPEGLDMLNESMILLTYGKKGKKAIFEINNGTIENDF